MLVLQLKDMFNNNVEIGDVIEVNSTSTIYYIKVQLIDGILTPYDNFSYDSLKKVNDIPENAIKNTCDGLEFHYIHKTDKSRDRNTDSILSHHSFTRLREKNMYSIKEVKETNQLSLF
jgi:hypothetical protein